VLEAAVVAAAAAAATFMTQAALLTLLHTSQMSMAMRAATRIHF
jgi:hypothetical protein